MLASVAVYVLVRGELRSQVDSQLQEFAGGVFAVQIHGRGPLANRGR